MVYNESAGSSTHSKRPHLRYLRQGSGKPLVLVHGYFGGAAVWQEQIEALSARFDVIAPEHAGYGESAALAARDSIADFASDILDLLDELGIDSFYLLGHSMGGMIAQHLASNAPSRVEKLVCYGTGPHGTMPNRFETIDASRQRLHEDGAAATGKRIAAKWFVQGAAASGYPATIAIAEQLPLENALAGLTAMEKWDGFEQLPLIKQPTLVLWGDGDQSYQWALPESLWRHIKRSNLAVMPNCGHNAHMENPTLFHRLVVDFLS